MVRRLTLPAIPINGAVELQTGLPAVERILLVPDGVIASQPDGHGVRNCVLTLGIVNQRAGEMWLVPMTHSTVLNILTGMRAQLDEQLAAAAAQRAEGGGR